MTFFDSPEYGVVSRSLINGCYGLPPFVVMLHVVGHGENLVRASDAILRCIDTLTEYMFECNRLATGHT